MSGPTGTIAAIRESLNHPLVHYLAENTPHPLSDKSTIRLESVLTRLSTMNMNELKLRPCLVIRERVETGQGREWQQSIYLMGTMQGKNRLKMDSFTQHFAIPIYPAPGYGDYQLRLTPRTPKDTSYLIGCPLGVRNSNPLQGLWREKIQDPETNEESTVTYTVSSDEILRLRAELRRRQAKFNARRGDFKEHIVRAYLKVTEVRTRRPETLASRRPRGPSAISVLCA